MNNLFIFVSAFFFFFFFCMGKLTDNTLFEFLKQNRVLWTVNGLERMSMG